MPLVLWAERTRAGRIFSFLIVLVLSWLIVLASWVTLMKVSACWWYTLQSPAAAGVLSPGGRSSQVGSWQDGKTLAIFHNIYLIHCKFCSSLFPPYFSSCCSNRIKRKMSKSSDWVNANRGHEMLASLCRHPYFLWVYLLVSSLTIYFGDGRVASSSHPNSGQKRANHCPSH